MICWYTQHFVSLSFQQLITYTFSWWEYLLASEVYVLASYFQMGFDGHSAIVLDLPAVFMMYMVCNAGDKRTNFKYTVSKIANLLGLSVTHEKLAHTVLRSRRQKKLCVI